jgi:hypothetical protein
MIILQTASGGDAGSINLDALLSDRRHAPSTTFRNNDYIHRLNRALQAEMRALAACRSLLGRHPSVEALHCAVTDHHFAGKELVRLVIANRGVPEDRAALSLGLTGTFIRVCSAIPVRIFERASFSTLVTLEKSLATVYAKLLVEAPLRDQEALDVLLKLAEKHQEALTSASVPREGSPR